MSSIVSKDIELQWMPSVVSSNPTLTPDALACWWRPCGVTWDAVPEQSWYLKLLRKSPFIIADVLRSSVGKHAAPRAAGGVRGTLLRLQRPATPTPPDPLCSTRPCGVRRGCCTPDGARDCLSVDPVAGATGQAQGGAQRLSVGRAVRRGGRAAAAARHAAQALPLRSLLSPCWMGPFQVLARPAPNTYRLDIPLLGSSSPSSTSSACAPNPDDSTTSVATRIQTA